MMSDKLLLRWQLVKLVLIVISSCLPVCIGLFPIGSTAWRERLAVILMIVFYPLGSWCAGWGMVAAGEFLRIKFRKNLRLGVLVTAAVFPFVTGVSIFIGEMRSSYPDAVFARWSFFSIIWGISLFALLCALVINTFYPQSVSAKIDGQSGKKARRQLAWALGGIATLSLLSHLMPSGATLASWWLHALGPGFYPCDGRLSFESVTDQLRGILRFFDQSLLAPALLLIITWKQIPREHLAVARKLEKERLAKLRACPQCNYSLAGLETPAVCPECGRAVGAR